MPYDNKDLGNLVLDNVPEKFLRLVLYSHGNVYKEANSHCYEDPLLEEPEARFLLPYSRRALLETQLRRSANECGLPNAILKNSSQNFEYTLVRAGRIVLTGSAVRGRAEFTRAAVFRSQHASVNEFLMCPTFAFVNSPKLYEPGEIYGIIVHCPDENDPSQPAFVGIGIPSADSRSWLGRPWSLEDMILAHQARNAPAATTEDRAKPTLKPIRKPSSK